jgi:hypothetical protein
MTPAPTPISAPAQNRPSPQPAAVGRLAPESLLAPADLTLAGAYPVAGWRRCDDYTVDRNLERYRGAFAVTSSVAAVWAYGSGCGSADKQAHIDEYAWRARNQGAAAQLLDAMSAESYLGNLSPDLRSQVREFGGSDVWVATAALPGRDGKTQFVAEIVGQRSSTVAYMRVITAKALSDAEYLQLGRAYLDRAGGTERPSN